MIQLYKMYLHSPIIGNTLFYFNFGSCLVYIELNIKEQTE